MDAGDDEGFESEAQFWEALEEISRAPHHTHEHIDDALRSFLALAKIYKPLYLPSEQAVARCCYKLLDSDLFHANQVYVRRQILYCLLQEDDVDVQHVTAALLLFDGRSNEAAFEMLQSEGLFPRLLELIRHERDDDDSFRRLLLNLLFEMSRVQKLSRDDLMAVDDGFVLYLLQLIEDYSDDADDPYHYPIIRVLLVLNEQYMVLATAPSSPSHSGATTNRILKVLSTQGDSYRTFGENIILLLNRESTLSAQLLILKLLYLLFTTPSTYEYFYTNDLHVLVDVIIRNLLDLDPGTSDNAKSGEDGDEDGHKALRHTYLRVLCPLLKNTQLAREGSNYKRDQLRELLYLLANRSSAHFAPVDETVLRLVIRCRQIPWLKEEGDEQDEEIERKLAEAKPKSSEGAKNLVGMTLEEGGVSSLSVVDVSSSVIKSRPAVPTPRRLRKRKPPSNPVTDTNGANGDRHLKPPSSEVSQIEFPDRDGGRSPFSDDNREVD